MTRSTRVLFCVAAMLAACAIWISSVASTAHTQARRAAADASECELLAARLTAGSSGPALAHDRELGPDDLRPEIQAASGRAGITAEQIIRIRPDRARSTPRPDLMEQPTSIVVRRVRPDQALAFMDDLERGPLRLRVQELRLSGNRSGAPDDLWTVEATVSRYFVRAPAPTRPANSSISANIAP